MLHFDNFWRENSNSNRNHCIITTKISFIFGTKIQIHNFVIFPKIEFFDTIWDFLTVCNNMIIVPILWNPYFWKVRKTKTIAWSFKTNKISCLWRKWWPNDCEINWTKALKKLWYYYYNRYDESWFYSELWYF